jgi:hypothetical protein
MEWIGLTCWILIVGKDYQYLLRSGKVLLVLLSVHDVPRQVQLTMGSVARAIWVLILLQEFLPICPSRLVAGD